MRVVGKTVRGSRAFSYSTKESGSYDICIQYYRKYLNKWHYSFFYYCVCELEKSIDFYKMYKNPDSEYFWNN